MKMPLYLDYQSTTPVDPRVLDKMLPYFSEDFGNAASRSHLYGLKAKAAVDRARGQLAVLLGVREKEILFTSGATESNNLALLGLFQNNDSAPAHLITCRTEHRAVLDPCAHLEKHGVQVTYLDVNSQGQLDLAQLKSALRPETKLISLMAANNEIGTLHPLKQIGEIAREAGVFLHTDAAQLVGKMPLKVKDCSVDLLSLSGHKFYGPKGVGALFINQDNPRFRLHPIVFGGGHEEGLRSGTLNVPGIVGMGEAAQICQQEMSEEAKRLQELRDKLWRQLQEAIPKLQLNGSLQNRLPHNLNFSVAGVSSDQLLMEVRSDLALSAGSACTSASPHPSHVLKALGLSEHKVKGSLRLALGRLTQEKDLETIVSVLAQAIKKLRQSV